MNAPHQERTNVIPTRHVTTLTGPTLAGASKDTKAMVETVQVNICVAAHEGFPLRN